MEHNVTDKGRQEATRLRAIIAERGMDLNDTSALEELWDDLPINVQDTCLREAHKIGSTPKSMGAAYVMLLLQCEEQDRARFLN